MADGVGGRVAFVDADQTNGQLRVWWDRELPVVKLFTADGAWKRPLAAPPLESTRSGGDTAQPTISSVSATARTAPSRLYATEFVTEVDEIAGPMDGSSSWEDEGIDERLTRLIRISNELRSEGE